MQSKNKNKTKKKKERRLITGYVIPRVYRGGVYAAHSWKNGSVTVEFQDDINISTQYVGYPGRDWLIKPVALYDTQYTCSSETFRILHNHTINHPC